MDYLRSNTHIIRHQVQIERINDRTLQLRMDLGMDDALPESDRDSEASPPNRELDRFLQFIADPAKIIRVGSDYESDPDSPRSEGVPQGSEVPHTRPLRLAPGDEWDVDDAFWDFDPARHAPSHG